MLPAKIETYISKNNMLRGLQEFSKRCRQTDA